MDFELDSVLVSHMGEGNWKVARKDRPDPADRPRARHRRPRQPADDRVLGAARARRRRPRSCRSRARRYRLLVGHGEVLDTPELPNVEMPYFHFRPDAGVKDFMDEWLRLGGPHHFVTNLGEHAGRWRRLAELLDLELEEL